MSGRAQPFANGAPAGDAGLKEQVATRFAKNLRACRTRADFTQEDLGRRASLHRNQVGLLESGTRVPRIDVEALWRTGEPLSAIALVDLFDGRMSMWEAAYHLRALEELNVVEPFGGASRADLLDLPDRLKGRDAADDG
jgi:transcriptional regulator with XRE-family HTH domain